MKTLNADIKSGQLKNAYLLFGDEIYLKNQYKTKLLRAAVAEDDTMNFARFDGKGIEPGKIIDLAQTMPFFAERRVILVENSGFFKNAVPEFADYIAGELPETTCLIFVEEEVDKRGKLYKAVAKKGYAVELSTQSDKTLLLWIASRVKEEGKAIRESTARYLLEKVGSDMSMLSMELEKLFSYCMDENEITKEAVDAVCRGQISDQIFAMVEAVAWQNSKKAMSLYFDLLALREKPLHVMALLVRQFRILLLVKDMAGAPKGEVAKAAGINPYFVGKYQDQASHFSYEEIEAILEDAAESDRAFKSGNISEHLMLELFISRHSARKNNR